MIYSWKKIVKHSMPLLSVCIIVEIFAGQILQSGQNTLLALPIFLISIPVINGVSGNVGSVIGARLASGLHVGSIEPSLKEGKIYELILTSVLIGFVTYFILAIIIYLISSFGSIKTGADVLTFMFIFVGSGVLLVGIITFFSIFTAFSSFRKGYDPDDWIAPVVTTAGDTLGILFLIVFINFSGVGL
ncbi:MAG: magnesium transporter [Candidatus Thermoplasmatota archaeon]